MHGASLFAAIALIPAMCGPAGGRTETFEVALCRGGTLTIPLRGDPVPSAAEPCCAKGCHSQRRRAGTR